MGSMMRIVGHGNGCYDTANKHSRLKETSMVYRMIFNQTAYFGRGAIKEIPGVAKSHGFTKAFIVTDPVLLETGTVKKVTDVLDEAGMP